MEFYELISSAVVGGIIPIKKYKSKATGFTVCIASVDGPLVNGYFCLATEALDDDGLPHTLEHLVFMGSEEYPYKGMLDLFANRCLAQGTNAWTDTDHTCYTMTTAGSVGFINLLPIYLDHILYPTLTESAYHTEVHHINDKGEDAGVVYCEMQARENTGHSLTHLNFARCMYPGKCGYKSETGGIMKNLRTTCSHEKVCKYHSKYYRPDNLCLVITGNVNPEDVFIAIKPFEDKIKSKGDLGVYKRPWQSEVPPLESVCIEKHVVFPTDDESTGLVHIGWRGPNVLSFYEISALQILFRYLTDSPIAPLQRELVETDDPLCGEIDFTLFENRTTALCLEADNVPKENIFDVKDRVMEVLKAIADGSEPIDMERMTSVIHRALLEEMDALEDRPHETVALLSIGDFLFSETHNGLQEYMDKVSRLEKLKMESTVFWTQLLNSYVIEKKMVVIVGDPSENLMKKMGEDEQNRIAEQVCQLGEDGLKAMNEKLDKAIKDNEVEPLKEIINELSIPPPECISFHHISCYTNKTSTEKFPLNKMPCAFKVYDVKSLFSQITLMIDIETLSDECKILLPLYAEILFESPVVRNGVLLPYEEAVKQLAMDTLDTGASIGLHGGRFSPGSFSNLFVVSIKVENSKYRTGVQWLRDVLYNLRFSVDRFSIVSNKIINDVANYKRDGKTVAKVLLKNMQFKEASNIVKCNMIRQQAFLTHLLEELKNIPDAVLQRFERLRSELLQLPLFRVYVACNLDNLQPHPNQPWEDCFFKDMDSVLDSLVPVTLDSYYLKGVLEKKAIGIGSVESAFFIQSCTTIDSYEHSDYPAMLVFIEYLCALEGPLWRQIRGLGLSYSYSMQVNPAKKTLVFVLSKSTHVFHAYKKAKEIVGDYVSGRCEFEIGQIEAARSGAIFQIIEEETTLSDAVNQAILSEFERTKLDFRKDLLKKLAIVSREDLMRVGAEYFGKLFDAASTITSLCCHPTKVDEIVKGFNGIGVEFQVVDNLEDEILSQNKSL